MERSGKLYEAIQFYKRAVQLVPDIEFRLDYVTKKKPEKQDILTTKNLEGTGRYRIIFAKYLLFCIYLDKLINEKYKIEDDSSDEEMKEQDLLLHIQRKLNKSELFCISKFEQKASLSFSS